MLHRALVCLLLFLPLAAVDTTVPVAAPDLAVRVGRLLSDDYYDRTRIKPALLIQRALRSLEGAEIGLDTLWDQGQGQLTLKLADKTFTLPAPEPRSLIEAMGLLDQIRAILEGKEADLGAKRGRDLGYALINGALSSLDPHTVLMPPEPAEDFDQDIRGEFGGIGAYLHQDAATGEVQIERVMPERPAELSGVQDGDVIVAVDGESTAGLSLEQCVRRIKGPKGSTVTLTLRRKAQIVDIAVVRDIVQVPTMATYRQDGIGYLRMDEFNAKTHQMLVKELIDLQRGGNLEGLVLDLRYNGGGLLDQAYFISDLFLPKDKEVVRTIIPGGEPNRRFASPRKAVDAPIIILVGPGSASAAEILSGALQCNDRAVVAGATTFGKGSVQSIRPLHDGSRLKLTIQEYRLAGGVSIQDVGITPDLRLDRRMLLDDGTVDLTPFSFSREVDEEFALVVDGTYQHASTYELGWMAEQRTREELRRSNISSRDFVPDQEAQLVIDLFQSALALPGAGERLKRAVQDQAERQALLELLRQPVADREQVEAQRLAETLAKLDPPVRWGEDADPVAGSLSVTYTGPTEIVAGTEADLTFQIRNQGAVDLGRLYGILQTDRASPFFEEEVIIGAVPAGGEATGHLRFTLPPRLHTGSERFTFALRQDGRREPVATTEVTVAVTEAPRPHLSLRYGPGEGAQAITPGGTVPLVLTVINDGEGDSAPLSVSVFKDNDTDLSLGEGVFRLEGIPAGGTSEIVVPLTLKAGSEARVGGMANIQVHVEERFDDDVDARYRATLFHKLALPIGQELADGRIDQPRLRVVDIQQDGSTATVDVAVSGKDLRYVSALLDREKVDYRQAANLVDGIYRVALTLKPGLNSVRILASGADDITDVLPLRLWGPVAAAPGDQATAEARPKPAQPAKEPAPAFIP